MNRACYLLGVLTYSVDSVYTKLMLRRCLNVIVLFISAFYKYGQNSLGTYFNQIFVGDISPARILLTASTFNWIDIRIRVNTSKCETRLNNI